MVSLAVLSDWLDKTRLLVATDEEGRTKARLELPLDDFVRIDANQACVSHSGRTQGGLIGATNAAMLDWLDQRSPHLIGEDGRVNLGTLPVGRRIQWGDARNLIVRLVEYAFAREAFVRDLRARNPLAP